jgi:hypothetical protein
MPHPQGLAVQKGSISCSGVDSSTLQQAAHLLEEHNKGIKSLQAHLDKVWRDINVVTAN